MIKIANPARLIVQKHMLLSWISLKTRSTKIASRYTVLFQCITGFRCIASTMYLFKEKYFHYDRPFHPYICIESSSIAVFFMNTKKEISKLFSVFQLHIALFACETSNFQYLHHVFLDARLCKIENLSLFTAFYTPEIETEVKWNTLRDKMSKNGLGKRRTRLSQV